MQQSQEVPNNIATLVEQRYWADWGQKLAGPHALGIQPPLGSSKPS